MGDAQAHPWRGALQHRNVTEPAECSCPQEAAVIHTPTS